MTTKPRNTTSPDTTDVRTTADFYQEQKWCVQCDGYVRFLMSVNHSYCVDCGGRVRLFDPNDSRTFHETVARHKWQAS